MWRLICLRSPARRCPKALAVGLWVSRLARAVKELAGAEHVYSWSDCGSGPMHPQVGEDEMQRLVARLRSHVIDE